MQAECEGRCVSGIYAFYLECVFANKLASTSCYTAARVRTQKYYFTSTRRYHARLFLFDFARPRETPNRAVLHDRRFSPDTDIVIDIDIVCADHERIQGA